MRGATGVGTEAEATQVPGQELGHGLRITLCASEASRRQWPGPAVPLQVREGQPSTGQEGHGLSRAFSPPTRPLVTWTVTLTASEPACICWRATERDAVVPFLLELEPPGVQARPCLRELEDSPPGPWRGLAPGASEGRPQLL